MRSLTNPLGEAPQVRRWVYRVMWMVGIVLGSIQAWYVATAQSTPSWLTGAFAVLAYVSIATHYTADQNVSGAPPLQDQDDGYRPYRGRHGAAP